MGAEIFTVFAKTPVTDPATGTATEKVSAFIVERSFGGVTNGPPEKKMGIKCSVVLGEVAKRGKGAIGIGPGNVLSDKVHPNLSESAALTCKAVDAFGQSVEKVLIKHGKNIINEQFILNRLANATIDIYANTCVLSRCTKSINEGLESAHQEELMTKVWCRQSYDRIMDNLNELKNPETLENYKTMAKISEAVCAKNAPVQGNPLGF